MSRFVLALGRADWIHDIPARVELLGNSLDRAALAGRVPAFEDQHNGPLLHVYLIAELAQLDLPTRKFAHVGFAIELFTEVDGLEHQTALSPSFSIADRRSASRAPLVTGGAADPNRFSIAPMMVSKIFLRANHFDVASTIVHGPYSDSVISSICSAAARYCPYFRWRAQSSDVTRHASSGSASIASKRAFCSFLLMCRKNLRMTTPSSASMRSNSTMSR